jgi:hypothetical protein
MFNKTNHKNILLSEMKRSSINYRQYDSDKFIPFLILETDGSLWISGNEMTGILNYSNSGGALSC